MTLHELFLVFLGFVIGIVARPYLFPGDRKTERLLMKRLLEEREQRWKSSGQDKP
jgi:hypothetical protein